MRRQCDSDTGHLTNSPLTKVSKTKPVSYFTWVVCYMMIDENKFAKSLPFGPILFDVCAVFLFSLLFAGIPELGFEPYRRGFFCDDQSIRLPYKPDSVTPVLLLFILLFMLFGTVGAVEFYLRFTKKDIEDTQYSIRGRKINGFLIRFCTYSGFCIFGLIINLVICNVTKYLVGRLRPHFLDVCQPDIDISVCKNPLVYITNYTCTFGGITDANSPGHTYKKNARLSFFSGHSSMTMHVAIFCVVYLYARLPRRMYGISLLPIFQTILVMISLSVGYSRISDHKHHWSDVLCGFIAGLITGTISAVYIAQLLKRQSVVYSKERARFLVDSSERIAKRDPMTSQQLDPSVQSVNLSVSDEIFSHRRERRDLSRNELDGVMVS